MQVKDVMTRGVECVGPDTTLQDAAAKMRQLDVGPLPVMDQDRLLGIITDRDITIRAVAAGKDPRRCLVKEAMSGNVETCTEEDDVDRIYRQMKEKQLRRIVVMTRDRKLAGIVSLGDLAVRTRDDKLSGQTLGGISEQTRA